MSNLIIKNSDKLKQISELYSYLSIKLNTERLNEEQVKTIQYKLNILNENLDTINENIEDIITHLKSTLSFFNFSSAFTKLSKLFNGSILADTAYLYFEFSRKSNIFCEIKSSPFFSILKRPF